MLLTSERIEHGYFITYPELVKYIYGRWSLVQSERADKEIHDLWMLGAPHPMTWARRLIIPSQLAKLIQELLKYG